MTKTETVKPKSNRGGARPGSGRKKGSKNRATIEREEGVAIAIDQMRRANATTGKDALEKMLKFAEAATAVFRPTTKREQLAGAVANPDGDLDRFGQWFDRWAYCAKELAKYQSPTFRAIAVTAPPPVPPPDPQSKVIDQEGNVLRMATAEDAEHAYLKLIGAAA